MSTKMSKAKSNFKLFDNEETHHIESKSNVSDLNLLDDNKIISNLTKSLEFIASNISNLSEKNPTNSPNDLSTLISSLNELNMKIDILNLNIEKIHQQLRKFDRQDIGSNQLRITNY